MVNPGGGGHRGKDGRDGRTPKQVRHSDPDVYKIDVLASGSGVVAQGGHEARLRPRDLTLVDLARPANWNPDHLDEQANPRTVRLRSGSGGAGSSVACGIWMIRRWLSGR
jgi:AraC-binding-like domain